MGNVLLFFIWGNGLGGGKCKQVKELTESSYTDKQEGLGYNIK